MTSKRLFSSDEKSDNDSLKETEDYLASFKGYHKTKKVFKTQEVQEALKKGMIDKAHFQQAVETAEDEEVAETFALICSSEGKAAFALNSNIANIFWPGEIRGEDGMSGRATQWIEDSQKNYANKSSLK